jgi:hypothetical protein
VSLAFELSLMIFQRRPGADLSKGARLSVPKRHKVFRVEGDDKIILVALKCHQPFWGAACQRPTGPPLKSHREIPKKIAPAFVACAEATKCGLHNPEGVTTVGDEWSRTKSSTLCVSK